MSTETPEGSALSDVSVPRDRFFWRPAEPLGALARRLAARDEASDAYLDELEERFGRSEAEVLSMVPEKGRFERLRRDLTALRRLYPDRNRRPPLFAVPVAVKDVIHVEGFETRAGSTLPAAELAGAEAPCIRDLRTAGALLLGKAACTELAYFAPGPTRNPHHLDHTPGGSSSGSAAAVAAGLAPLALGTQTIGSVARPAAFCGVVGFKPTYGRVSTRGVVPLATSLDHVGWLTSDSDGVALAARVLVSDWNVTAEDAADARRPLVAVAEGPHLERVEPDALAAFDQQLERAARGGVTLSRLRLMEDFDDIEARHRQLLAADFYRSHRQLYERHGDRLHPTTRELLERGKGVDGEAVQRAREGCDRLRWQLEASMDAHGVDLLIAPSATGPAPLGLGSTGDPILNLPFSHAGLPTLTLPAGLLPTSGGYSMPIAVQLVARFGRDESLLAWGNALERIFRG
ncbi:MAG: amidase [Holophagales bacterium]|nr:amidase [Holophagales bacterium]